MAAILIILMCTAIGAFMIWMIRETLKLSYMDFGTACGLATCIVILAMCVFGIALALAG